MAKAKHTPLPWGYDGDGFDSVAAQLCDTDGYTIFPVDEDGICTGQAEANADFIVRACNSHYHLLQILKEFLQDKLDLIASENRQTASFEDRMIAEANAAISKAESK